MVNFHVQGLNSKRFFVHLTHPHADDEDFMTAIIYDLIDVLGLRFDLHVVRHPDLLEILEMTVIFDDFRWLYDFAKNIDDFQKQVGKTMLSIQTVGITSAGQQNLHNDPSTHFLKVRHGVVIERTHNGINVDI